MCRSSVHKYGPHGEREKGEGISSSESCSMRKKGCQDQRISGFGQQEVEWDTPTVINTLSTGRLRLHR